MQFAEETDELLLADEDAFDVDPDSLPRHVLSDFSVYNAEVRLLLPEYSIIAMGMCSEAEASDPQACKTWLGIVRNSKITTVPPSPSVCKSKFKQGVKHRV